eukprot:g86.t1
MSSNVSAPTSMWTLEEQEMLRDAFQEHSPDDGGRLKHAQLAKLFVAVGSDPDADERVQALLQNGDGANFDEFLAMMTQLAEQDDVLTRDELLRAFRFFDRENKGFIPDAELRNVLRFLGDRMSAQEAEELVYLSPGHGCIEYERCVDMVLGARDGAEPAAAGDRGGGQGQ